MIAGFVSATRSLSVVVASARTGRQARTASATTEHQSAVATAGCAPSGHGEKPVSGFNAPMATWSTNRTAVRIAAMPSPGISRRRAHPPAAAYATTMPTMAAMYRWAMWTAAAPLSGTPSLHSGQVEHAAVAPSPRTYAPESSRTNVPMAAAAASQVKAVGLARPGAASGHRTTTAYTVRTASSSSAFARWTVTQVSGSSRRTVIAPRIAWSQYRTTATPTNTSARRSRRYRASVQTASAASVRPATIARKRCSHSMRVATSSDGRNWPWHSGQSGQPRPEPVTRTMPPQNAAGSAARRVR